MLSRLFLLAVVLLLMALVFVGTRAFVDLISGRQSFDRPPVWRDRKVLTWAAQILALGLIIVVVSWLWSNFRQRTDDIGMNLSFSFLSQPAQISIADNPTNPNSSISVILVQATKNTFLIILLGIPLSVAIGTFVGIARLSANYLVRKLATVYVESFRNIPPLIIIVFVWGAAFLQFPAAQGASAEGVWRPFGGWFIFSNSRFAFPSVVSLDLFGLYQIIFVLSVLAAVGVWIWRTWVFNNYGTPHRRVLWSTATLATLCCVFYFVLQGPFEFSKTIVSERVWSGGFRMQMPYVAVMLALAIYTSSHIAEILRGSILAVSKGQTEASHALALSGFQRYRFVVLPQAFRIAFPALINQFLNYAKNSSLAVAIGFPELTSIVNNLFGQSQPAPQLLLVLMSTYLWISLMLSLVGNLINRRLKIPVA